MTGASPVLARETLSTSRLADFCTEKGLVADTGHPKHEWPLVVFKELTDNALDIAEETGNAPVIEIEVSTDRGEIIVTDNGPGIPAETIAGVLDYTARTSSRALYPGPTRGQQGNALSTIVAMSFVLDGKRGETIIEAHGQVHRIVFTIDPISGEPRILCDIAASLVKNGTKITVKWPSIGLPSLAAARGIFLEGVHEYSALNPHLTIAID